jgi:hypothetical protein
MRSNRASLAAAAMMSLAIVGCGRQEERAAAVAPNMVVFTATDFAFQGPDTIPSGLTRVRLANKGPSMHHVQFLQLGAGKTFDSLMAAFHTPGPLPAWVVMIAGPNAGVPGVDTTEVVVNLPAGRYAVVCFIPDSAGVPHVARGMAHALTVKPSTGPAATAPVADITLRLTDYDFTPTPGFTAGTHTIRIENAGLQAHEMLVVRLDSGVTAQQLLDWVRHGMHGRPPARPLGGISGMAVGRSVYIRLDLTPGDYALYCFFPDIKDGKEHVEHGMMKQFHVS